MNSFRNAEEVLDAVADASYFSPDVVRPDLNTPNIFGDRPLQVVITWGDINAVKLLLDAGAPLNAKNENGNTALHHALQMGQFAIARCLITAGADQSIRNDEGKLPRDMCWEGEWGSLGLIP
jgi:ankyrin repeat protein